MKKKSFNLSFCEHNEIYVILIIFVNISYKTIIIMKLYEKFSNVNKKYTWWFGDMFYLYYFLSNGETWVWLKRGEMFSKRNSFSFHFA